MYEHDRLLVRILLLSLLGACVWVLLPFMSALFWAAVLAFASWPLMRGLSRRLDGRNTIAAAILSVGWILLVALPLVWVGMGLADHVRGTMDLVRTIQVGGLPPAPEWVARLPWIGDRLVSLWQTIDARGAAYFDSLKPYLGQVGNWLLARSARIGGGVLELALSLVLVFFFYRDGPRLVYLTEKVLLRLIGGQAGHYMQLVGDTVHRVVNGILGTAAAQAILALIGLMIAGVPGAVGLALLTFALSLIPVGPPLVWIPSTLWLVLQQEYGYAIFLGAWGLFFISGVDNILKPYLISRGGDLPLVVVLLGVFGGLLAFGFMGLFLGPILLAVAYNLIRDWMASAAEPPSA
ncbi:AI-2E family transporter [Pseudomonas duriflava]|nr:AI-2E family transporter [Pseudomonas duriflava]